MLGIIIGTIVLLYGAFSFRNWILMSPRFVMPLWRSKAAFLAFSLGWGSCLLFWGTGMLAILKGGFRYYDPLLMKIYGLGFLAALAGFLMGVLGMGKLRLPAVVSSLLMMTLWILVAGAE